MISNKAYANAQQTINAIFGREKGRNYYAFYFSLEQAEFDRLGMKLEVTLRDGSTIKGRYSHNRNFNGTLTTEKGDVKKIRCANAYK